MASVDVGIVRFSASPKSRCRTSTLMFMNMKSLVVQWQLVGCGPREATVD